MNYKVFIYIAFSYIKTMCPGYDVVSWVWRYTASSSPKSAVIIMQVTKAQFSTI